MNNYRKLYEEIEKEAIRRAIEKPDKIYQKDKTIFYIKKFLGKPFIVKAIENHSKNLEIQNWDFAVDKKGNPTKLFGEYFNKVLEGEI